MDIPDDIRGSAIKIFRQYTRDPGSWSLVDLITEALITERARTKTAQEQPNAVDSKANETAPDEA